MVQRFFVYGRPTGNSPRTPAIFSVDTSLGETAAKSTDRFLPAAPDLLFSTANILESARLFLCVLVKTMVEFNIPAVETRLPNAFATTVTAIRVTGLIRHVGTGFMHEGAMEVSSLLGLFA